MSSTDFTVVTLAAALFTIYAYTDLRILLLVELYPLIEISYCSNSDMSSSQSEFKDRILTCGVELELELAPKPNIRAKNASIFSRFDESQKVPILAAIIDRQLQLKGFRTRCLGFGNESEVGGGIGGQYRCWKVVHEFIVATGSAQNCMNALQPTSILNLMVVRGGGTGLSRTHATCEFSR